MSDGSGISIAGTAPKNGTPAEVVIPTVGDVPMETTPEPVTGAVTNPQRSVEGWVIVATGVHEEAREEDLRDMFSDYGKVRNLHLILDRQTGYAKGYALIEYALQSEAEQAIRGASNKKLLGKPLTVDFAFIKDGSDQSRRPHLQKPRSNHRDPHAVAAAKEAANEVVRTARRHAEDRERERSPDRGF
ncbi:RNA-binding protein 8A [Coemansia furcata]|uniref:RNA-binding protein 8A n=1 Tax=Coemansia furcata TaxID=417177 RepID=A0ACC1KVU9_9FUNG|nr:RNA-binding protein 8A [Coemansia furcata]KAJ2834065.1 RNA-binding protein 8A [Coemansia furcata]